MVQVLQPIAGTPLPDALHTPPQGECARAAKSGREIGVDIACQPQRRGMISNYNLEHAHSGRLPFRLRSVRCLFLRPTHTLVSGDCTEPLIGRERVPQLGEKIPQLPATCAQMMAASAQMWPSYLVQVRNVSFTIGVDSGRVRAVTTSDHGFSPPEGLHVGDSLAKVAAAAPDAQVLQERGWGHFVVLPSGWSALLDDSAGGADHNLGKRPLGDSARIAMFFMRD